MASGDYILPHSQSTGRRRSNVESIALAITIYNSNRSHGSFLDLIRKHSCITHITNEYYNIFLSPIPIDSEPRRDGINNTWPEGRCVYGESRNSTDHYFSPFLPHPAIAPKIRFLAFHPIPFHFIPLSLLFSNSILFFVRRSFFFSFFVNHTNLVWSSWINSFES